LPQDGSIEDEKIRNKREAESVAEGNAQCGWITKEWRETGRDIRT